MNGNSSIDTAQVAISDKLAQRTANIVAAYVRNHVVPMNDLATLIGDVHSALAGLRVAGELGVTAVEKPKPAVPIKKSVEHDCITCLEDGLKFKSLKRHLMTTHKMTPEQYRAKWVLPDDYPMVAPSYAQRRSELAKDMGLGNSRKKNQK